MIDVIDDTHRCLTWRISLLRVDQVGDLEVHGEIRLEVLRTAGLLDVSLEG